MKTYGFCRKCGSPLIDGWIVSSRIEYSPTTGKRVKIIYEGIVCQSVHDKVFPFYWYSGWYPHSDNPTGGHDAFERSRRWFGLWGEYIPYNSLYSHLKIRRVDV